MSLSPLPGLENVAIPWAAGCQSIGIMDYREAKSSTPRGIVGMMDISARNYMRTQVGNTVLTFTVPYGRFQEMEPNVEGSFLEEESWKALLRQ